MDWMPNWCRASLPSCDQRCPAFQDGRCLALGGVRTHPGSLCAMWASRALGMLRVYLRDLRQTARRQDPQWIEEADRLCGGIDSHEQLIRQRRSTMDRLLQEARLRAAGEAVEPPTATGSPRSAPASPRASQDAEPAVSVWAPQPDPSWEA